MAVFSGEPLRCANPFANHFIPSYIILPRITPPQKKKKKNETPIPISESTHPMPSR
ncbi:unnamed protein product [Tuber melanosporum]|uniref:(Perigord truffle) hypothetical protein n=1 Tax=Tuber melanosporum (strain Mel28) TaxID=656061 RepID=D5GMV1_TUBMM|nr:uncharacterized protein GSTUM_00010948001 [Tuber melanosporum]CAZ85844.1 unnamed protein product [Tuber melanosporum]